MQKYTCAFRYLEALRWRQEEIIIFLLLVLEVKICYLLNLYARIPLLKRFWTEMNSYDTTEIFFLHFALKSPEPDQ